MSAVKVKLGYLNWVKIKIINKHETKAIQIKNAKVDYGKFYEKDNKDAEIPASQINGKEIKPGGGSFTVSACGRSWSPSGTEGSFDLVEATTGTVIRNFYWDCPHDPRAKWVELKGENSDWVVNNKNFILIMPYEELGNGEITCEAGESAAF